MRQRGRLGADTLFARYPSLAAFLPGQFWKWITEYLSHRFGRRHPFPEYRGSRFGNGIYTMPANHEVRIALAGDWATGTDEAEAVGKRIAELGPHYTIHLGDVYYVGDAAEVAENFLGERTQDGSYTPCRWPCGSHGSFAMNGNHEMYALGYGYFDRMLPALGRWVDGAPEGQGASFFCLENGHWRIIALDTGYNSVGWPVLEYVFQPNCALRPELMAWLQEVVRPTPDDPRGIILLSHHPYFSYYERGSPKAAEQMLPLFPKPVLWLWGHEHRLVIYKEFSGPGRITTFGRCIGNGGMPIELPPKAPKRANCEVEFVDNRPYRNDEGLDVACNGFVAMRLRGDELDISYVDLNGDVAFSEAWIADAGTLKRVAPAAC